MTVRDIWPIVDDAIIIRLDEDGEEYEVLFDSDGGYNQLPAEYAIAKVHSIMAYNDGYGRVAIEI